jgi:hypothetical protein
LLNFSTSLEELIMITIYITIVNCFFCVCCSKIHKRQFSEYSVCTSLTVF